MGNLSPAHLLVLVVVMAMLFGGSRLADIGKGLGEGIRNFKKGLTTDSDDEEAPKQLQAGTGDAPAERRRSKRAVSEGVDGQV